ncbi:MAG TPA: DUF222 domain-containing protein, partial [Streptosporangiaceae bacterium]
ALAGKAGPEDTRSLTQRRHDALEEACHRLIAAGMVPGRDGQPLRIYAHMDLARLASLAGAPGPASHSGPLSGGGTAASRAESRWSLARTVAGLAAWCPTGPDLDAAACDATVIPVITGHVDWSLLDHVIALALPSWPLAHTPPAAIPSLTAPPVTAPPAAESPSPPPANDPAHTSGPTPGHASASPAPGPAPVPHRDRAPSALSRPAPPGASATHDPPVSPPSPGHPRGPGHPSSPADPVGRASPAGLITPEVREQLRQLVIQHATELLSGPTGLAAQLRTNTLDRPLTGRSQPLDVGTRTPVIPPHLRRAVTLRDQHCRFPGCTQPPPVCQIHHLTPRAAGGPTALGNLALLCRFHHLTVIHHWNWTLTSHPDGTTTATSPDGRTLHSHSPPCRAA